MQALLLIDIQNDFLPGGALAVPGGDQILPVVNKLIKNNFDLVVASQDWHPIDHCSFASNHDKQVGDVIDVKGIEQMLWPVHCVQDSDGAAFPQGLDASKIDKVIHKGTNAMVDSYSAFFDNGRIHSTGLTEYFREKGIDHLIVAGLATDYCVHASVMDALKEGFKVTVIIDACRGVGISADDIDNAITDMKNTGAIIATSQQLLAR